MCFSAEIDNYAINTYLNNFSDDSEFNMDKLSLMGSKIIDKRIPDHDILVGGFPCQTFSNAGKKAGFNSQDTRGTQFYNILKIIDVKKPKFLILENVKHLYNHDDGKTFKIIKNEIIKRGYQLPENPIILSPHNFGIPQTRSRVFLVAELNRQPKNFLYKSKNNYKKIINFGEIQKDYPLDSKIIEKINAWGELLQKIEFLENRTLPVIWIDEMISNDSISENFPKWKKNIY